MMTRNASDCLLCHLTGLFGDQRQKEYDDWLLQKIEQTKGLAFPAVHFSELHSGLNILSMWREKEKWQSLIDYRNRFDVLQINATDPTDTQLVDFLQWNQRLETPFHIFIVLSVQAVKEDTSVTIEESYLHLRQMIETVFSVCQLPVAAISFENDDYLWKESPEPKTIEPRNHYLLRHIRSAMDRIGAQQTLFIHSQGGFKDVNDYFSDGNNEIQLAGSVELNAAMVKCLQEGNTESLVGITSQFHLNSLETAYFHTLSNIDIFSDEQREFVHLAMLSLTGFPVLNVDLASIEPLQKMLDLRMKHDAFHVHGAQIQLGCHTQIWAIQRYSMDMSQSLLCLANFSSDDQKILLGEDDLVTDECWKDVFTGEEFVTGQHWTLKPYQVLVLI